MAESSTDALLRQLIEQVTALARVVNFDRNMVSPPVASEPVKEPPKPAVPPPVTPPVQTGMGSLDFRTLILSGLAAVIAPATGVSETVDKATLGSLVPYVGMAASALGIPTWILPLAGRFIGGLFSSQTGAQK